MRVGMLGLGRMGRPMATHLRNGGYEVVAYDVDETARAGAAQAGIDVADSPGGLAGVDLVCSSLPATEHVEDALFGDGDSTTGLASLLAAGTVWADLSTISIDGSRALAGRCEAIGVTFLDTPVSGTSIHAEAGTLVVMAGGPVEAFERARPALATFATRVDRVGPNGAGLELKLVTNRLLTTHLAAIAEAILVLERTELSVDQAIELLRAGAVPRLLDYKAEPLTQRDYTPLFTVDLMRKDLRLAAEGLVETPLATAAHELVEAAAEAGHGDDDLAAIIAIIEARLRAERDTAG
ncbi:MAG: NAD(P)-dependent oxidoreductase [Acidimicrobiales bacterium]